MRIALLTLLLFTSSPRMAFATDEDTAIEKPEAPKPNHKIFFVGSALLAASKTADSITTEQLLNRGGLEGNWELGPHPSPLRLGGTMAAYFVGQSALFYFTEKSRHAWIRWAGRAYIGLVIVNHAKVAACNTHLDPRSPVPQSCHAFTPF